MERNEVLELTLELSLMVIEFSEVLEANKKYVVARQLLKSGTSIGANSREAQGAESRADFIHKFKIAAKEAEETVYWLTICKMAPSYPDPPAKLTEKLDVVCKIIGKIIATSKQHTSR